MNSALQAGPRSPAIPHPRHAAARIAKTLIGGCSTALALALCLPGFAHATDDSAHTCSDSQLKGRYVFTASGFTRAPASPPGSPWVPKAILEVLQFNGDGTVLTPAITAANPFGDLGAIMQPPGGAPGEYTVNADCTGTVHFFDPSNVTFSIYVQSHGATIRMIQTNPSNNVFEGSARRSR